MRTTFRCLNMLAAAVPLATAAATPAPHLATPARPSRPPSHITDPLYTSAVSDPTPASADASTPAAAPAAGASHDSYETAHGMHEPGENSPGKPAPRGAAAAPAAAAPAAAGIPGEQGDFEMVDIGIVIAEVGPGPGSRDGGDCNGTFLDAAIYDAIIETYAETLEQMVAVACSGDWRGLPGDLAALVAPWSITWSQITGAADSPCSESLTPPGSTATGCAWSAASAYAAAFALADTHAATAAAAFAEHCAPRCAAGAAGGWEFAGPDTTLLVITDAYAAATTAACADGQTSASAAEWSLCYSSILGDKITQALVRALLDAECYAAPQAAVVEAGLEALAGAGGLCFAARA